MSMPTILNAMTPFPHSIGATESIEAAQAMMSRLGIRHLPVTREHEIVGILSERDIHIARSLRPDTPATEISVERVCTMDPYTVELDQPLDVVVRHIADQGIGSAIVVRKGQLAGIFTTTDACRYLSETLAKLYRPPTGNDAA